MSVPPKDWELTIRIGTHSRCSVEYELDPVTKKRTGRTRRRQFVGTQRVPFRIGAPREFR